MMKKGILTKLLADQQEELKANKIPLIPSSQYLRVQAVKDRRLPALSASPELTRPSVAKTETDAGVTPNSSIKNDNSTQSGRSKSRSKEDIEGRIREACAVDGQDTSVDFVAHLLSEAVEKGESFDLDSYLKAYAFSHRSGASAQVTPLPRAEVSLLGNSSVTPRGMLGNSPFSESGRKRSNSAMGSFALSAKSKKVVQSFLSDLATKSLVVPDSDSRSTVESQAWIGSAAVLFIDISGYSKVTSALASQGAHALSAAVNGYLEQILYIVCKEYKGDVVKFAGDAVVVVWPAVSVAGLSGEKEEEEDHRLTKATLAAVHCATTVQHRCNKYEIPNTEGLTFRTHMAVATGRLFSDLFLLQKARSMQPGFHFLSGKPLQTASSMIDVAKAGEVCIDEDTVNFLGTGASYFAFSETNVPGAFLVKAVFPPKENEPALSIDASIAIPEDAVVENDAEEDEFKTFPNPELYLVHPAIVRRLHHGIEPSQMAEMRFQVVAFIHMSEEVRETIGPGTWFAEVASILDEYRCPVVQVIDDDKGIHIVAAINLVEGERDPCEVAVFMAYALLQRKAMCTIGVACGVVFNGVIGSSHSCRWDITGPACVRACRLMQYGISTKNPVVLDESILNHCNDKSLLRYLSSIEVKGSSEPVHVYEIARGTSHIISNIQVASSICHGVHVQAYTGLCQLLKGEASKEESSRRLCIGAVVSGCVGSGKTMLCLRVANECDYTCVTHICRKNTLEMGIAYTIGKWLVHHADAHISSTAQNVIDAYENSRSTLVADLCFRLVQYIHKAGLRLALIIRHAQFLDSVTLKFLSTLLTSLAPEPQSSVSQATDRSNTDIGGVAVLLTHFPLDGYPGVDNILTSLKLASTSHAKIPHFTCNALEGNELTALIEHRLGWDCAVPLRTVIASKSGQVAAFIDSTIAMIQRQRPYITQLTRDGVVHVSSESERKIGERMPWPSIDPPLCANLVQLLDTLSPKYYVILKLVAVASKRYPMFLKPDILESLYTSTVSDISILRTFDKDIQRMRDLKLIGTLPRCGAYCCFTPALRDAIEDLATPAQLRQYSKRCAEILSTMMHDPASVAISDPVTFDCLRHIAVSSFYLESRELNLAQQHLEKASTILPKLSTRPDEPESEWIPWKTMCEEAMRMETERIRLASGSTDVHPTTSTPATTTRKSSVLIPLIPMCIVHCKNYFPPLSIGPLGSVLMYIGWTQRLLFVDCANERRKPLHEQDLHRAKSLVSAYFDFLERIDACLPEVGIWVPEESEEEVQSSEVVVGHEKERSMLVRWLQYSDVATTDSSAAEAISQRQSYAEEFMKYVSTTVKKRGELMESYFAGKMFKENKEAEMDASLDNVCKNMKLPSNSFPLLTAWNACKEMKKEDSEAALAEKFAHVVMGLATAGWTPLHPRLSLGAIRDAVLTTKNESYAAFQSCIFVHLLCSCTFFLQHEAVI